MKTKTKIFLFMLLLVSNSALAAKLEDVKVLEASSTKDGVELKLQSKGGAKDSYFVLNVTKSDRDAFDKLALVIKKLKKGNDFRLGLDIPSFSAFPSGSYYRSEDVVFSGIEP